MNYRGKFLKTTKQHILQTIKKLLYNYTETFQQTPNQKVSYRNIY